ncbi:hypothetical protein ALQ25_02193 [Pseudomonas coronafaciens pv. atropurpurea]|nr:hypothetical protein ALQ25_02193 [Pseudomonas coronafaciens pv. atropurpurea]
MPTTELGNSKLVCDDFAGYNAGLEKGMTETGCMTQVFRSARAELKPVGRTGAALDWRFIRVEHKGET